MHRRDAHPPSGPRAAAVAAGQARHPSPGDARHPDDRPCLPYVPLLAVAVRSLCHETAARRLIPILVLAPYAVWLAVSMDAIVLLLAAGFVTLGVVGSEPGRSPSWAFGSGLVLGSDAMLNYAVAWLGVSLVAVYFVRRRPLLNVFTGVGALLPLRPPDLRLRLDRRAFRGAGRLLGTRRAAAIVAAVGAPRPAAPADRLRPADHPRVATAAPHARLAVRRRSGAGRHLRHSQRPFPRRGRTLLARLLPVPAHPRRRPRRPPTRKRRHRRRPPSLLARRRRRRGCHRHRGRPAHHLVTPLRRESSWETHASRPRTVGFLRTFGQAAQASVARTRAITCSGCLTMSNQVNLSNVQPAPANLFCLSRSRRTASGFS